MGVPLEVETPHPRHARDRIPERLAGATLVALETRGKHLLMRFSNDLRLHVHLRMSGRIDVQPRGAPWRRGAHRAWLVLRSATHEAVLFDGPVLELLTPAAAALHPVLSRLGGDVLAEGFDAGAALARARRSEARRPIADVLLDQSVLAGVGNVWKSEALFRCGIAPARPVGTIADDELAALLDDAAAAMRAHVASGAARRPTAVYGRAGRPCLRCGTSIRSARVGDEGRTSYWCPACQR